MTQQTIPPNTPINVTLEAAEWNIVLDILSGAVYRVVAPVIQKIGQQATTAMQMAVQEHDQHDPLNSNGHDKAPVHPGLRPGRAGWAD